MIPIRGVIKITVKKLYWIATLYFGVLFLIIANPRSMVFFNRSEPFIMGLPGLEFMILCYILMNAAGLLLLFFAEERIVRKNISKTEGNPR
ncbi:MAG TPA: hypothetical protein VN381_08390 [Anaerovoracaceae bacterium]|nr:hypothetical protein [Anaerovoracaceae bacterium]